MVVLILLNCEPAMEQKEIVNWKVLFLLLVNITVLIKSLQPVKDLLIYFNKPLKALMTIITC